jgi:hypothetical protein
VPSNSSLHTNFHSGGADELAAEEDAGIEDAGIEDAGVDDAGATEDAAALDLLLLDPPEPPQPIKLANAIPKQTFVNDGLKSNS